MVWYLHQYLQMFLNSIMHIIGILKLERMMDFLGKATQIRFLEWQWMKWTSWSPAVWMTLCAIPTLARGITGELKCCLLLQYNCFTARVLLILYGKKNYAGVYLGFMLPWKL